MLPLDPHTKLTTQLTRDEARRRCASRSTPAPMRAAGPGTPRAQSAPPSRPPRRPADRVVPPPTARRCPRRTSTPRCAAPAPTTRHAFAALNRIVRNTGGWADTEIVLPDEATPHRGIVLHPVMLDAALQGLAAAMTDETLADSTDVTYLPVGFGSIRVFGAIGRRAKCRAELVSVARGQRRRHRPGHPDRRHRRRAGPGRRRAPQAHPAPHRATSVVAEDLRLGVGGVATRSPAATGPTGSWLALADGADGADVGTGVRDAVRCERSPRHHRRPRRRGGCPRGVRHRYGRSGPAACRSHRVRRSPRLRRQRCRGRAAPCARRDLGRSGHRARRRRQLARQGASAVAGQRRRSGRSTRGDVDRATRAPSSLKGLVRVLAYEHPDLRTTLLDVGTGDAPATLATEIEAAGTPPDRRRHRLARRYPLRRAAVPRQAAVDSGVSSWSARTAPTSSPAPSAASAWRWSAGWWTTARAASWSTAAAGRRTRCSPRSTSCRTAPRSSTVARRRRPARASPSGWSPRRRRPASRCAA